MTIHELKTWNPYFEDILNGLKQFELRFNDRKYALDDILILKEYLPEEGKYTGRVIQAKVNYIIVINELVHNVDDRWIIMNLVNIVLPDGRILNAENSQGESA